MATSSYLWHGDYQFQNLRDAAEIHEINPILRLAAQLSTLTSTVSKFDALIQSRSMACMIQPWESLNHGIRRSFGNNYQGSNLYHQGNIPTMDELLMEFMERTEKYMGETEARCEKLESIIGSMGTQFKIMEIQMRQLATIIEYQQQHVELLRTMNEDPHLLLEDDETEEIPEDSLGEPKEVQKSVIDATSLNMPSAPAPTVLPDASLSFFKSKGMIGEYETGKMLEICNVISSKKLPAHQTMEKSQPLPYYFSTPNLNSSYENFSNLEYFNPCDESFMLQDIPKKKGAFYPWRDGKENEMMNVSRRKVHSSSEHQKTMAAIQLADP